MSEKDIKFTNFSDSPEYIDIFNDENTSSLVNDNEDIILGANCSLQLCTSELTCLRDLQPTGNTASGYSVLIALSIAVNTTFLDGAVTFPNYDTTSSTWGRKLRAKYIGTSQYEILVYGKTYTFTLGDGINGSKGRYYHSTIPTIVHTSSCATTVANGLKNLATIPFEFTFLDGHDVYGITGDLKSSLTIYSGISVPPVAYTSLTTICRLPAMTYGLSYHSGTTSNTNKETVVKTKIGTKYQVYNSNIKSIIGKTKNGLTYVKSVNYVSDASLFISIPSKPFFVQTSATSIYITYERPGSVSGGDTVILSGGTSIEPKVIPTQTSDGRLATINDLSNSNSLGINFFNAIFSSSTDTNRKYMVITPNNYSNLSINQNASDNTYKFNKPGMFYSGGSSNTDCCLRIFDISTFDKWMYVKVDKKLSTKIASNGYTYSLYPNQNVVDGREWYNDFSDRNDNFTLMLK